MTVGTVQSGNRQVRPRLIGRIGRLVALSPAKAEWLHDASRPPAGPGLGTAFAKPYGVACVLVVEDDADSCEVLVTLLRRAGHDVAAVPNGRDALAMLGEVRPDVVLLDLMMPQMDGPSFLKVLRSYLRWQHVPVIVLTAQAGDRVRLGERLRKWDVTHVLYKADYRLDELLSRVNAALASASHPCAAHPQFHTPPPSAC